MPLDDHVRRAVDRVLAEVRIPIDRTLRGLANANAIAIEARVATCRIAGDSRGASGDPC